MTTQPAEAAPTPIDEDGVLDLFRPLRSAGTLDNPYPMYQLLRSVRPVLRLPVPGDDGPGAWLLTRHAEVDSVLRDARFSVDRLRSPVIRDNLDRLPPFLQNSARGLRSMLVMDPPDHTRLRKLVNKAFTPRHVAARRERIEAILGERLDRIAEAGRTDLIHDIAEPLPALVIAELLGVPAADHRRFREWSGALIASIGGGAAGFEGALEAGQKILGYLAEIIAERRREPRDDLISAMIQAQNEDGALTDEELLATSNLLLLAGHETTTNLIGNGMLALLRHPAQLERLRAEPHLGPTAIEELLRFDGPVQLTVRVAREDVALDDQVIREGALVLVGIGAANHDPAVFADPDALDVGRKPNPHLAFGIGTHFCMGAPLARLEAELAIRALLERFERLELLEDAPPYRPNPVLRGLARLPIGV